MPQQVSCPLARLIERGKVSRSSRNLREQFRGEVLKIVECSVASPGEEMSPMWRFAWQNLMTRPARTILAIVGLSIPVFGVLGLLGLSQGIRNLMGNTLGQVHGILVIRANVPGPIFSDLPADMADASGDSGVHVVAPEIWKIAPPSRARASSLGRPWAFCPSGPSNRRSGSSMP